MDNRAIGRRVHYWRTRRGLTRQDFADRCDRSVSWVEKIETGERALVRLPMLERVAAALDVDVAVLTDAEAAERASGCIDGVEVRGIRAALGSYRGLMAGSRSGRREVDLGRLRRQMDHACAAWLSSHFAVLGRVLPSLIGSAQDAVAAVDSDERVDATRHLVMAYRLATSTLLKFEATDVAWLAADRAMTLAGQSDDVVCLARATRSVARAMTQAGQTREAFDVLIEMAARMEPDLGDDSELVSLYGMLLLPAEIAAATAGDADAALALHEQAGAAARALRPGFTHRVTAFGLANVGLHRVAALVRLHEGHQAVEFARTVEPAVVSRLPRERQATYLLDRAEAYRQTNQPREAGLALVEAERVAPEEVRCRPAARRLTEGLIGRPETRTLTSLQDLARRVGLPA